MLDLVYSTLLDLDTSDPDNQARVSALIDLDLTNGFALDYQSQLDSIDGSSALEAALAAAPTSITSTNVVWGNTTDGVVLSGLNLNSISTLEELQQALEDGLSTGAFTSIDFYVGGINVLSVNADGSDFSIVTGGQELTFSGAIPNSFQGIFDLTKAVEAAASTPLLDFTDAEFDAIVGVMETLSLSSFSLSDDSNEILDLQIGLSEISLNFAGLEAVLKGTFDFDNTGDLLVFIRDALTAGDSLNLSDFPEFGLTSLTVTGNDGTELMSVMGTLETAADTDFETITIVGTADRDRDVYISDYGFGTGVNVDLGEESDELEVYFDDFLGRLYNGDAAADYFLDGGTPPAGENEYDELDLSAGFFSHLTLNLETGNLIVRADIDALYHDYSFVGGTYTIIDPADVFDYDASVEIMDMEITNFADVDLDLWGGGEIYLFGNGEDSRIDLQSMPDHFEIDGAGGFDRLKFDNGYYEHIIPGPGGGFDGSSLDYLYDITLDSFLGIYDVVASEDGWYDVSEDATGFYRGRFRNFEEFQFLDEDFNDVFVSIEDLTDGSATRGTNEDDILIGDDDFDILLGEDGNDILRGKGDGDRLYGGLDDDYLFGDDLPVFYAAETAGQIYRLYQATLGRDPDSTGHQNWTTRVETGELTLQQAANGFVNSTEFQNTYGDLENAGFVELLYQNVLNRSADATGLARWVGDLEGGLSRAQVVLGFSNSQEFQNNTASASNQFAQGNTQQIWTDDVFRLYQATLDRAPNTEGLFNWSDRLGSGTDYLSVANGFVASQEFKNRFGEDLSNAAFVELLYQNVLDRSADATGLARWVGDLEGGASRTEVVRGFAQSTEFRNSTADALEDFMRQIGGGDELISGGGNDVMAGGFGSDSFVFRDYDAGTDTVLDLEAWDTIDLTHFGFGDFATAKAAFSQNGSDVIFNSGVATVVFEGVNLSVVDEDMLLV